MRFQTLLLRITSALLSIYILSSYLFVSQYFHFIHLYILYELFIQLMNHLLLYITLAKTIHSPMKRLKRQ